MDLYPAGYLIALGASNLDCWNGGSWLVHDVDRETA